MIARPARLLATGFSATVLAVLLVLQSGSSILMSRQPELAARLMPVNGLALEQVATREFQAGVKTADDIVPAANKALPMAIRAYRHDPLSPKSLAIMALAQDDQTAKRRLLVTASKLNRRDLLLQGLILDDQVKRGDYSRTLLTLDNILRVHPEQMSTIFPVLIEALKDDRTAAQLGGILDRRSTWHDQFLEMASGDREALPNLARIRLSRDTIDPEVDSRLIKGLVAGNEIDLAHRVYAKVRPNEARGSKPRGRLDWNEDYAPFDWQLADEAGFRADYIAEESSLEIFVRSGKGGILAERLIEAPATPFAIRISHSIEPVSQVKDIRLQIGCPASLEPVVDHPLSVRPGQIRIPALAARCKFMKVAIYGRSWSGKPTIRGDIARLEIIAD